MKRKYAISGWLVLILTALLLSGCAGKLGWRQKPYELTVLHTNNVHGGYIYDLAYLGAKRLDPTHIILHQKLRKRAVCMNARVGFKVY